MLLQKIQVFHFHNGLPGGTETVKRNLLKYSCNHVIENHLIYVINKDNNNNHSFPVMEGAVSQQVFLYSPNWNFYYTARQLAKLLPGEEAIIVAHDWLELGMVSALGLQHRVVQFLHGHYDYYYQLAVRHQKQTDLFIAVAANIEKKLKMQDLGQILSNWLQGLLIQN